MSHEFDDENTVSDAEPRQESGNEKVGFFRGLFRKLYGRSFSEKVNNENKSNPSKAENNETLSETELVAKINRLREKRDELNQALDTLWPVLTRSEDSAPGISRDMRKASEDLSKAQEDLKRACDELRKINSNNPILLTQKLR